jgi:hypothetical protein
VESGPKEYSRIPSTNAHARNDEKIGAFMSLKASLKPFKDLLWVGRIRKMFPSVSLPTINRMYWRTRNIEKNIIGRYAGTTIDKLGHTLPVMVSSRQLPDEKDYAHVEIGTLFGGSVISKLKVLQDLNQSHRAIAIDPLDSYYGQTLDPIAKVNVDEDTFWKNIEKFNLENDQVQLVKRLSTDPLAVKEIEGSTILTLLIDGDHSYEGVKNDWEKFSPLVNTGGYVIFDDYNEKGWPDVTRFVDELIGSLPEEWTVLGVLDTVIIFQKR